MNNASARICMCEYEKIVVGTLEIFRFKMSAGSKARPQQFYWLLGQALENAWDRPALGTGPLWSLTWAVGAGTELKIHFKFSSSSFQFHSNFVSVYFQFRFNSISNLFQFRLKLVSMHHQQYHCHWHRCEDAIASGVAPIANIAIESIAIATIVMDLMAIVSMTSATCHKRTTNVTQTCHKRATNVPCLQKTVTQRMGNEGATPPC